MGRRGRRPGDRLRMKFLDALYRTRGPGLIVVTRAAGYESGSERVDFEDPNTGARIRKESDIDVSTVL